LNSVGENDFIDDVVIPIFNQAGYATLRINSHGPGEHGKDIVFYRHVPPFFDNEYVVVQAKCQIITAANVTEMAYQLVRGLRTPIKGVSGGADIFPNYVVLFNSRRVSNDAHWEFPYLVDGRNNIKILNQENVCEMMIQQYVLPGSLSPAVMQQRESEVGEADRRVCDILLQNKAADVEELFENTLVIIRTQISKATKTMLIEYIFNMWEQDSSWDGTVKPMKWLDKYFEFVQKEQYRYLNKVFDEYVSTTPSFRARLYVESIIGKLTSDQILLFRDQFFYHALDSCLRSEFSSPLVKKLLELEEQATNLKRREQNAIKDAKRYLALRKKRVHTRKADPEEEKLRNEIADKVEEYQNLVFER
jgi:hypothetical protein